MAQDAVSITIALLRCSPRCPYPHLGFGTRKVYKLAPVLGNILDMGAKCRFIGDDPIGTIKISLHPIGYRFG